MNICLTGLDIHGIQGYLCATGKLREIVGASGLVKEYSRNRPVEVAQELGMEKREKPDHSSTNWFVPIRHAGGVVRFLFAGKDDAKRWARAISSEIITHAPGMNIDVAHVPYERAPDGFLNRLDALHREVAGKRNRPRRGGDFPGLPITALCNLTGDPAEDYGADKNERLSASCRRKREYAAQRRANAQLRHAIIDDPPIAEALSAEDIDPEDVQFPLDFSNLPAGTREQAEPYMAVACFDGNSIGRFIREYLDGMGDDEVITGYREFCRDLDEATSSAYERAALEVSRRHFQTDQPAGFLPLRPLIQGGDDVTVVLSAHYALEFAQSFMQAFREETAERLDRQLEIGGGMALVKRKSPFLRAYELAESMLENAKSKTREQSCLDFQLIQKDSPESIRDFRQSEYVSGENDRLTRKPYTLTELEEFLQKTGDLQKKIPRTQLARAARFCRIGHSKAQQAWHEIRDNLARGLGGREGQTLMDSVEFNRLYKNGFFVAEDGTMSTDLIDCIEAFRFVEEK